MTSNPPSRPSVLVLGARGRFGRAAVTTFRDANWQVRAFVRPNKSTSFGPGIEIVEGDAFDLNAVRNAAREVDVIVHALNPPYPRWQQDLPRLTESVLNAARAAGASVMIPGNVYNYGSGMPENLREETSHLPTTRKGVLREAMEQAFRQAAGDGVHTVVLRAGDFIESARTGNWFDTYVTAKLDRGIAVYPGPLHQVHAWAYLPDMARAMVALAEREGDPTGFESFNFGGYNVTGAELVAAMEAKTGRPLKVRSVPWLAMRLIAPFVPLIREVLEMRYLWNVPHAIDGSRLQETLPNFRPTPLPEALDDVLPSLAASRAPNGTTGLVSAS
jgi:nucleoside-diphosphate-sugar epimerase